MDKNLILQRAPELILKLRSDNSLKVRFNGEDYFIPNHGLAILNIFSHPRSLAEALELLDKEIKGSQDWIDITKIIIQLYKIGVLQRFEDSLPRTRSSSRGFDSPAIHIQMLNDQNRTRSFLRAIQRVVNPGDVVIDIGTGTGVLAVEAAKAGAKKVYAIEASGISSLAQRLFSANQVSDQVVLVEGWSTEIDLPERADVLVSEIIGNDPFDERVLEVFLDAQKRFIKPDGVFLPSSMEVFALPLSVPPEKYAEYIFMKPQVQAWNEWYGIKFDPAIQANPRQCVAVNINSYDTRNWKRVSSSKPLKQINFATLDRTTMEAATDFIAEKEMVMNGVLIYFELEVSSTELLSVSPDRSDQQNSWRNLLWLVPEPLELQPGDPFVVHYSYGLPGVPDGIRVEQR